MEGVRGRGVVSVPLVETGEGFFVLDYVAQCNIDIADEFVDVLGDDLELDGHFGEAFAAGVAAFLDGELVYCSQLEAIGVRLAGALRRKGRSNIPERTWIDGSGL